MASKSGFFRSSKGGRFKRTEAGDLGLRAYKEQQNEIIQALQTNKATANFFAQQQLGSLKRLGDNQQDNLRVLNTLEQKIYQGKKSAITKRKETEVGKLKDEAKISGQKAQWLAELAPKAAKAAMDLTFATEELYSKWDADQKMKEIIEEHGGVSGVIAKGEAEKLEEDILIKRQEAWNNKDVKGADYLSQLVNGSNRFLSQKLAKQIIQQSDSIEEGIRSIVKGQGGEDSARWNSKDIPEYYKMRARELIQRFGLTGEGADLVYNHFETKGSTEAATQGLIELKVADTEKRSLAIEKLHTKKDTPEYLRQITDTFTTYDDHPTREGKYNKTLKGFDNGIVGAALLSFEDYIKRDGVDAEQAKIDFLAAPAPGCTKKDITKCQTMGQRHGKASKFQTELNTIISNTTDQLRKQSEKDLKNKDWTAGQEWNRRVKGEGEYAKGGEKENESLVGGLKTEDQFNSVLKLFRDSKNKPKTQKAIGEFIHLNPRARDITTNQELFWQDSLNGNFNGAMAHWNAIEKDSDRTPGMRNMLDSLKVLNANGMTGKDVSKHATNLIKKKVGMELNLNGAKLSPEVDSIIVPALQGQFNHYLNLEVAKEGGADAIIKAGTMDTVIESAWIKASEDLTNNQGMFQTDTDKSGKTFFIQADPRKMAGEIGSSEQISQAIVNSEGTIDEKLLEVVPASALRDTAKQIVTGSSSVTIPTSVQLAYEFADKNTYPTMTSFVNGLLVGHGFGVKGAPLQLNDGVQEITQANVNRVWGEGGIKLKVGNMKDKDVVNLSVFTSIVNQTGHVPMLDSLRYDIESQPEINWLGEDTFNVIGGGFINDLIEQKAKLGLRPDYDRDGNIIFRKINRRYRSGRAAGRAAFQEVQ